ncbi:rRNA maturation RNase YbeY [Candidatus Avelusimicrobium fimicolum]|uniref:rRNA maturation RNase YbeY n=1 Tax=Candidatus Avelusimicrobium fimicolum TaxID=3416216 RepID=UPI0015AE893B
MISHIFYNTDIPKYLRKTGIFKACLERGLKQFAKQNIEVNVIFVDETEILRVNEEFLDHHYITDVISFNNERPPFDTGEPWEFGDIFVCYQVARQNAKTFGHTALQEMMMYVTHGALHLSGMDDHAPEDRAEMDRQAEKIISAVLKK